MAFNVSRLTYLLSTQLSVWLLCNTKWYIFGINYNTFVCYLFILAEYMLDCDAFNKVITYKKNTEKG